MSHTPALIHAAGDRAAYRFIEFFTVQIRNLHTRRAYMRAVGAFCAWLEERHLASITAVTSIHIAAYIEDLGKTQSAPTVKQHLAAIRMMFDWLATGGILPFNPASAVRGPKHVVKRGKTPVLDPREARQLLDSIDVHQIGSGPGGGMWEWRVTARFPGSRFPGPTRSREISRKEAGRCVAECYERMLKFYGKHGSRDR